MLLCTCISVCLCVGLVIKQLFYLSQPDISAPRSPTVLVTSHPSICRWLLNACLQIQRRVCLSMLSAGVWQTASECGRKPSATAGFSGCQHPAASWQHWAASPEETENLMLHSPEIWKWMNESTLGLNFKAKQVSIKMCSFLMSP